MVSKAIPARFTHDRRIIQGVEVFSVGKHTASDGEEIEVTADDLDAMVEAFDSGTPAMVPVKFGHTSEAFNVEQAAELLGITPGLITGEGEDGDGAILPGTVTKLTRIQNKLLADFDVIAPVAPMIEDGLLKGISVEIEGTRLITAITLLGAQRPAVKDLVPLQAATVMAEAKVYAFSMNTKNAVILPRKFHTHVERMRSLSWFAMDLGLAEGATIDDVIRRLRQLSAHEDEEENIMDEKGIRALLSIKDDDDILKAVTALKEKAEAEPVAKPSFSERIRDYFKLGKDASEDDVLAKLESDPAPDPAVAKLSEVDRKFAEKDTQIAALTRENTVRRFAEKTRNFGAVQGTPEELAERLANIEEKMGADAAEQQIVDWEATCKYAVEAGVMVAVGSHAEGSPGDWDAALTKWKEDHPREKDQPSIQWDADAIRAVSEAEPSLFRAHYKEKRIAIDTE